MARIHIGIGGSGIGNAYPLSESVHMTLVRQGRREEALNDGYGMLFVPGVILSDQTISERLAAAPGFVHADSGFGIAALRVDLAGKETDAGQLHYWTTEDFVTFREHGMRSRADFP